MGYREAALHYARSGNADRARGLVDEVMRRSPDSAVERIACARAMTLSGDFDSAFEHLSSAIDLGYDTIAELDADREFAELRKDPRYEQIVGVLR